MEKKLRIGFRRKEVRELFEKNNYSISFNAKGIVLRHYPWAKQVVAFLVLMMGILLGIVALNAGSWKMGLFSLILVGLPWTLHNWGLPLKVVFSEYHNSILIEYFNSKKFIYPKDAPEFIVDLETRTAFVSPFQEGYVDHHYVFRVTTKEAGSHTLFKLKSRGAIDELIKELAQNFSSLSIWKE